MPPSPDADDPQLPFNDPMQYRYEIIRPVVVFGDRSATQRAQETDTHPETVGRLKRRFEQQGMLGLLPDSVEVIPARRRRRVSDTVVQELQRLKGLYAGFGYRELARIVFHRVEHRIDPKTVKQLWEELSPAAPQQLPLLDYHSYAEPAPARLAVIALYFAGWRKRSIREFLHVSRPKPRQNSRYAYADISRPYRVAVRPCKWDYGFFGFEVLFHPISAWLLGKRRFANKVDLTPRICNANFGEVCRVPPFEAAFQAHMAVWRLDGKPRTARQFAVYKNCPLPTPQDRLFFLLTYLKTYSLQVVQGRLFGMGQSKANQWIHVLLPTLQAALRTLGDTPARSLTTLAQRLGVSEADAAIVTAPLEETPSPMDPLSSTAAAGQAAPLLPMTGPNGASSAPKTLLNRPIVIAARKKTTP